MAKPAQPNAHKPADSKPGKKLLKRMSSFRREMFWIGVSSISINILALATPLVMLQVFDRILAKGSMETMALIMISAAIAICLEALTRILRSHLSAWHAAQFEHRAMLGVTSRMLAMPLHQFERLGTGAHQDNFKSVQSLKSYYSGQTFQQIIDLPFVVLYIGVAAMIHPWIGLLLLGGYLIFSLVVLLLGLGHRKRVVSRTESDLRRGNFLVETLNNIHTLKSMSMETMMLRRYERLQETGARAMASLARALDAAAGVGTLFTPLMTTLTAALGAYLVVNGDLTSGELAACMMLGFRALAPIQRLGPIWARHQQEGVMRENLSLHMSAPELPARANETAAPASAIASGLQLSQASYQFPGAERKLLDGISLEIKSGECVAIHGDNGCGRTTLLHLMCGMISPTEGTARLDGQDLRQIEPDTLHKRIAYLPQRTHMFEGTLLENITVFDPQRTDAALGVARELRIDSFVAKMQRGWDSPVGDASSETMPPGHRQRIAIVRALSAGSDILLFDDASAAVDSAGESFLLDYLKSIKGKCTIVIVSQRPSLQRLADRSLTLADGKLHEGLPTKSAQIVAIAPEAPLSPPPETLACATPGAEVWQRAHATIQASFKEPSDLAVCLPALLKATGWRRSPRDMAETLPYFADTLDLTGFDNAMAQLGYSSHHVPCRLSELDARSLPCLFLPRKGPAFVVLARKGGNLLVTDDAVSMPREIKADGSQGNAYFYSKLDEAAANQRDWVRATIWRFRPLIIQAGLASIISGLVIVTSSLFLMAVYNKVIPSGSLDTLAYMAVGVLIALVIGGFFIVLRSRILAYLAGRIEYLFGSTILQKILSLSPGLTERASVGSQIARLSTFEAIREPFTGPMAATLLELPAILVILITLGIINPLSLPVFAVITLIYFGLYWWVEPISARLVSESGRTSTRRNEFIVEMINKMRTIRECGATHAWLDRFRDISAQATMATFKAERQSALLVGLSYGIMMLSGLVIVTFTVPATLNQTVGPGALLASMILMWRVLSPMQTAFINTPRIERLRSAIRQIETVMRIKGERQDTAVSPVGRELKGKIDFGRVSFRYSPTVDPALVGVSIAIQPGQIVAITGRNGSGKSSLIKLLLGLYQPQAGSILIDDIDIRQLDPIELRRLIGYAPQEPQFFRATIAQNLRLARPDATDEEVLEALEQAGALEQVLALPRGLDYRVGDNASAQIPSSLRGKLALARAYLTKAPIMLFDEPGAGLDNLGDTKFMEMLKRFRGNTTVLFITHRPSHMRLADSILVFDSGYLRASGLPDEILKAPAAA
ncbi:MAG: ATP-binding cassette domain-containing protein [Betaproteobacteria bacterium]|nr:ATP-binding cassette domain-containing protein [Betaproteobacteria bacterium]